MSLVTASSINFDLHPLHRVIGYYIYDEMDKDIADIRDLLVDEETHVPRYAIIEIGGFLSIRGKKILIPWVALKKGGISRMDINCSEEHIAYTPVPKEELKPTQPEEESIHFHFSVEPYWLMSPEPKIITEPDTIPETGRENLIDNLTLEENERDKQ